MPELATQNDRMLSRASRGDQRAFAAIFERYHQRLYRYCAAILGDPEDARDALQNTMVKVLSALPGEPRKIELEPWLYRIAHNEAIGIIRRRRDAAALDPEALPGLADPQASFEARERLGRTLADLGELPERQRGALVMRELGGLSFDQVGGALECSARVARQTVYEARVALREMEGGREMACDEVRHRLSDGDRRLIRRRDVRAHLRDCAACWEFQRSIDARRTDLAAIAPLPAVGVAGLMHGVLGGAGGQAAVLGGQGAGAAGVGALGKAVAGSTLAKTLTAAVIVTAVGVGAVDRSGIVQISGGDSKPAAPAPAVAAPPADAGGTDSRGLESAGALAPGRARATWGGIEEHGDRARAERGEGTSPASQVETGSAGDTRSAERGRGVGSSNAHGGNPHAAAKGKSGESHGAGKAHATGRPPHAKAPKSPQSADAHAVRGQSANAGGRSLTTPPTKTAHRPPASEPRNALRFESSSGLPEAP